MLSPTLNKGFTLIELMITLSILGILSAIAIPAYNGYITSARMSEAQNNLASLRLAEEEYYLENNEYFEGANTAAIQTDSDNLWLATKGDGGINFDYAVTLSAGGWEATATGKIGTSIAGKKVTISK